MNMLRRLRQARSSHQQVATRVAAHDPQHQLLRLAGEAGAEAGQVAEIAGASRRPPHRPAAGHSAPRGCRAPRPCTSTPAQPGLRSLIRAIPRSGAPARRGSRSAPATPRGCSCSVAAQASAACRRGSTSSATAAAQRPAGLRSCAALRRCRCAGRWPRRSRRRPSARPLPRRTRDRCGSPPRRAVAGSPGPGECARQGPASPGPGCRGCTTPLATSWSLMLRARFDGNRETQADVAGHRALRIEAGGVDADQFAVAG